MRKNRTQIMIRESRYIPANNILFGRLSVPFYSLHAIYLCPKSCKKKNCNVALCNSVAVIRKWKQNFHGVVVVFGTHSG